MKFDPTVLIDAEKLPVLAMERERPGIPSDGGIWLHRFDVTRNWCGNGIQFELAISQISFVHITSCGFGRVLGQFVAAFIFRMSVVCFDPMEIHLMRFQ